MKPERTKNCLAGLLFDAVSMDDVIDFIEAACNGQGGAAKYLATINVNYIVTASEDRCFRRALLNADLCCPDGMPIIWLNNFLGLEHHGRITGSDLLERLIRAELSRDYRVFIFGTTQDTAVRAREYINSHSRNLKVVGSISPGFVSAEELGADDYIDEINRHSPDILFISLSAKKALRWIEINRKRLNVKFICQIGAAIDFAGGKVKRSPLWLRNIGFEWFWRMAHDRRLIKRYFYDGAVLIYLFMRYVIPYKMVLIKNRNDLMAERLGEFEIKKTGYTTKVYVRGVLNRSNYHRTKQSLGELTHTDGGKIEFELSGLKIIDNASLALLLGAINGLQGMRREVKIMSANKDVRQALKYAYI